MKRIVSAIKEVIKDLDIPAKCNDRERACGADGRVCDFPYCETLDEYRHPEEPEREPAPGREAAIRGFAEETV